MVVANGKGVSLITEERLKRIERTASGYVWRLPANSSLPSRLALNPDIDSIRSLGGKPEHYLLCPVSDMNLEEYLRLLSSLENGLERIRKL